MEQHRPVDRAHSLVAAHAHLCLSELLRRGTSPRPEVYLCALGNRAVLVMTCPAPVDDAVPGLSECERAPLRLLARAVAPLPAGRVCKELEAAGEPHGLTTVHRALRRLRRDLCLVSFSRRAPNEF